MTQEINNTRSSLQTTTSTTEVKAAEQYFMIEKVLQNSCNSQRRHRLRSTTSFVKLMGKRGMFEYDQLRLYLVQSLRLYVQIHRFV